jgi:hypothetical protein
MPLPPLPSGDLRFNLATWAVPVCRLPGVAAVLAEALPREPFDSGFRGQDLATTYFDTPRFALRKARKKGRRYLTLRLRRYGADVYALSAKTEDAKFRREISAEEAEAIARLPQPGRLLAMMLPADLQARLLELAPDGVAPVVCVRCRRYAVEDDRDRLSLDVDVRTDRDKALPFAVLEFKSSDRDAQPPGAVTDLGLRPLKLSKFLWATEV